jgi:hypothetical protein
LPIGRCEGLSSPDWEDDCQDPKPTQPLRDKGWHENAEPKEAESDDGSDSTDSCDAGLPDAHGILARRDVGIHRFPGLQIHPKNRNPRQGSLLNPGVHGPDWCRAQEGIALGDHCGRHLATDQVPLAA